MTRKRLIIIWSVLEFIVLAVVAGMWVFKLISLAFFSICAILISVLSTVVILLITHRFPPEETAEGKIESNKRKNNSWR